MKQKERETARGKYLVRYVCRIVDTAVPASELCHTETKIDLSS